MLILGILKSRIFFQQSIFKQLVPMQTYSLNFGSVCNQKMLINKQTITYCEKHADLSSVSANTQIISALESPMYYNVYTAKTQDVKLNLTIQHSDLPSFALFGLSSQISVKNSQLAVKLPQHLAQGALICIDCDFDSTSSVFTFQAHGLNVSGLILRGQNQLQIEASLIQFRLGGNDVGGLIFESKTTSLSLSSCNISGYIFNSQTNGSLINSVFDVIQISTQNVQICVNVEDKVGVGANLAQITGDITNNCEICGENFIAYGICLDTLDQGSLVDNQLICQTGFVFEDQKCICPDGQIQNGSSCINILETTSEIKKGQKDLQTNLTTMNQTIIDLNKIVEDQNDLIKSQTEIIKQLTQQLICSSVQGYSMVDDQCVQISCSTVGQQSLNGICQCTIINAVVKDNFCQCPENSNIIDNACVCKLSGQAMQKGQCLCHTKNAFVDNNACTCGVNALNISNSCSCPKFSTLIEGVCTCDYTNAYINGDSCICPIDSNLIDKICTCPTNSTLKGQSCVCNVIPDQIMSNSVCICQTKDAFLLQDVCSCGIFGLNQSNICTCPLNSVIIDGVCTCQIIGQSMVKGICSCPTGQTVADHQCKYVVNNTQVDDIQCQQQVYVNSFDILDVTHTIMNPANFSSGYVFASSTVVQNAFIDVSDNMYSSTISPIFGGQTTFQNIKVQVGTNSFQSGSLLSSGTTFTISNMNIISKSGSQITVSSALNVIQQSSSSARINTLLVNLSCVMAAGNITLIKSVSGVINVSNYQIAGTYQSTGCLSMIGILLQAATVTIKTVNFMPYQYNSGAYSSYFMSYVVSSTVNIANITLAIGSDSNFVIANQYSGSLSFGGVIQYLSGTSLTIYQVILDCYQIYNSDTAKNSGFLMGYVTNQGTLQNILIQNLCLMQRVQSTKRFEAFGFIGWLNNGKISVQQSLVNFTVQGNYFSWFGLIGYVNSGCAYTEFINVKPTVLIGVGSNSYGDTGSLFGQQWATNCLIQNAIIVFSNQNSNSQVTSGSIMGYTNSCNMEFKNITTKDSSISSNQGAGGLIGWSDKITVTISNSTIKNVKINANSNYGIITGNNDGHSAQGSTKYFITTTQTLGNFINNVLQPDCASITNNYSMNQCT
ncbi:Conserved_hypothetical protein [Hexamita inflata]|uniref:Uncharacterized protein n=1 Tax=Hexamita inflata TaxID=28002 RepID=A0AA86PYK9_9EUKA|nr:Conserved hypothetical protein [Hexamita inflata]